MRQVLLVHGINSNGKWQNDVGRVLEPHFQVVKVKYWQYRWLGGMKLLVEPWAFVLVGVLVYLLAAACMSKWLAAAIALLLALIVSYFVAPFRRNAARRILVKKGDLGFGFGRPINRYAFINIEMAQLLQSETETTDPRILRSRRMLMDALARLLMKKDFEDVSVQEIADEATLNRATFYLHYADKTALLHAMTESRFRDLIERRAITFTDCNGALRAIALGVCDYLAESTGCPTQLSRMALEGSIIPIVEDMFKEGLAHHGMPPDADASLPATTAAWAVFGAARRWFQSPNRVPAEEMAARIETMVSPILFGASQ
jgi:AcrR family transcriptional regulator